MDYRRLIEEMRRCARAYDIAECVGCAYRQYEDCSGRMLADAAAAIEALQAETARSECAPSDK